jgi:hypothetical protein
MWMNALLLSQNEGCYLINSSLVHREPAPCIFTHATTLSHPETWSQPLYHVSYSRIQNHFLPPKNFKISGPYFKTFTSAISDQNPHEKIYFNIWSTTNTIRHILLIIRYFLHILSFKHNVFWVTVGQGNKQCSHLQLPQRHQTPTLPPQKKFFFFFFFFFFKKCKYFFYIELRFWCYSFQVNFCFFK